MTDTSTQAVESVEWRDTGPDDPFLCQLCTPFGQYDIGVNAGEYFTCHSDSSFGGMHGDLKSAKTACEGDYIARLVLAILSERDAAIARAEAAEAALQEWRRDAAARLEVYLAVRDGGLYGTPTQVDVYHIRPTLAQLDADKEGFPPHFNDAGEPEPECDIDVDGVIARARAALEATS